MRNQQRGMSSIGWLYVLGSIGIFIMFGIKMIPAYMESVYVEDALRFIADTTPDLETAERSTIKRKLGKYISVNGIRDEESKSFKIKRIDGRLIVTSQYEKRENIVHNIDVVMSFKKQLDTKNPDLCCEYLVEIPDDTKK